MQAIRFERAATLFAGVSLATTVAAFAIGAAYAQPAPTTPIPQTPPVFNPSSPNTVQQPPYTPVAPSSPGNGLSGSAPAPISPDIATPVPSPSVTPPTQNAPSNASTPRSAPRPSAHGRRASRARAYRARHHHRYYAPRPLGPSYYPGIGLVYPPAANPCHLRPYWGGYWEYSDYTCGW